MNGFDYLHNATPEWVERIARARMPQHLRLPAAVLCSSFVLLAGAGFIEKSHYDESARVERAYLRRFELSSARLKSANLLYRRVLEVATVDRQIRMITISGDADARRLADIANRIPEHAWLTAIAHDASGMVLDGKARDLLALSRVVRSLMHSRQANNPVLRSAIVTLDASKKTVVAYELHMDTAP